MPAAGTLERWREAALRPVDVAGLAAFRVLFGALGFVSSVRFVANGWVEELYDKPRFFFKYWGFEWVTAPPAPWTTVLFVAMAVASLCIALGLFYRVATVAFFVVFTYVELIDVTNYLNHYYLVSLLAFLACWLPLHRAYSLDALRRPALATRTLPAWMTWLLRFQVGVVYVNASLAKANSDWLLHAQPLNIWLQSLVDTPLIGPWLELWTVALALSWAGFLYDLTIVPLLLWRRTRILAYLTVIAFHAMTGVFFEIGMFPYIMMVSTTVFFAYDWPRRLFRSAATADAPSGASEPPRRLPRVLVAALALWCAFHVAMPLRTHLYGGSVNWHEQGMRWSWRVMVREKNGAVTYRVTVPGRAGEVLVPPRHYLDKRQEREMSGQPDLILQLAHQIGRDFASRGLGPVEVRADVLVSLNGRPPVRLIDPTVDLMTIEDGLAPATWILPAPADPPARLERTFARHGD